MLKVTIFLWIFIFKPVLFFFEYWTLKKIIQVKMVNTKMVTGGFETYSLERKGLTRRKCSSLKVPFICFHNLTRYIKQVLHDTEAVRRKQRLLKRLEDSPPVCARPRSAYFITINLNKTFVQHSFMIKYWYILQKQIQLSKKS